MSSIDSKFQQKMESLIKSNIKKIKKSFIRVEIIDGDNIPDRLKPNYDKKIVYIKTPKHIISGNMANRSEVKREYPCQYIFNNMEIPNSKQHYILVDINEIVSSGTKIKTLYGIIGYKSINPENETDNSIADIFEG